MSQIPEETISVPNAEHDQFGKPCAGSRWFNREPNTTQVELKTFVERWPCPISGCSGEIDIQRLYLAHRNARSSPYLQPLQVHGGSAAWSTVSPPRL